MQSVIYHLDANELDNRLIDSIRSLFKSGRLTVEVHTDGTEMTSQALLSKIQQNGQSEQHCVIPALDFAQIASLVAEDDSFDAVAVIKDYKANR